MSRTDPIEALVSSHQAEALALEIRYDEARERKRRMEEAYAWLRQILDRQRICDASLPEAGCGLALIEAWERERFVALNAIDYCAQSRFEEADEEAVRAWRALDEGEELYRRRLRALAQQEQEEGRGPCASR